MRHRTRTKAEPDIKAPNVFQKLAQALIKHEQIVTTLPKAKELRPVVELADHTWQARICTPAVWPARLRDDTMTKKLFEVLGPRYQERQGGYALFSKLVSVR